MTIKRFFSGACLLLTLVGVGFAQTSSENATVKGRVTYKGRGASGVLVVLGKQTARSGSITAKTDREGHFRLSSSPGNYQLWVSAPGFLVVSEGRLAQQALPLTLQAGDTVETSEFELKRGSVITGKVTTEDNKPVIDMMVQLLFDERAGLPTIFPGADTSWSTVRTDDRGIYRFFGIPPGIYQVGAGDSMGPYMSSRGGPAFKRVFFPDALDLEKAKRIKVEEGEEVSGIDIQLRPQERGFAISGVVVDAKSGKPIPKMSMGLSLFLNESRSGGVGGRESSNSNGEFRIENVPPGNYEVYVPGIYSFDQGSAYFGNSSRFQVIDQDVTGIVVQAQPSSSISGRVVMDPNANTPINLQSLMYSVMTSPKTGVGRGSGGRLNLGPDGSFSSGALIAGLVNFQVQTPGVVITRVEHNGSVVVPLELGVGENISNVRIFVREASGVVRGTIKLSDGLVFMNYLGTATLYSDKGAFAVGHVDGRGNFMVENVPAGTFRIIVAVRIPGMHPASTHSDQTVTVKEREVSEVNVWLTPKRSQ